MEEILDKFLGLVPKEDLEKLKKLIEEKDKKIEELQQVKEERLYDLYALDEDIKILEKLQRRTKPIAEDLETTVCSIDEQLAITNLIEAYRILKDKVNEMEMISKGQDLVIKGSIPKSKIKEKIEELLEKGKQMSEKERQEETQFMQGKLKALEELLEEE